MKLLTGMIADKKRKLYIDRFVNKESTYYKENIQRLIECSDGICYKGYLWDCYNSLQLISEEEYAQFLKKQKQIFVMWDVNSKDYIFIPNYWKYPKEAILVLSVEEFDRVKDTFPEDVYLYDNSFSWSIALTHEYTDEDERYCYFTHSNIKYDAFPDKRVYMKEELEY